jgi:hypothetical protein
MIRMDKEIIKYFRERLADCDSDKQSVCEDVEILVDCMGFILDYLESRETEDDDFELPKACSLNPEECESCQ